MTRDQLLLAHYDDSECTIFRIQLDPIFSILSVVKETVLNQDYPILQYLFGRNSDMLITPTMKDVISFSIFRECLIYYDSDFIPLILDVSFQKFCFEL